MLWVFLVLPKNFFKVMAMLQNLEKSTKVSPINYYEMLKTVLINFLAIFSH